MRVTVRTRKSFLLTALVASAVVVKPGLSAPERTPEFHFIAAEHAGLTGTAQANGTAVWIYSGLATSRPEHRIVTRF